MDNYSTRNRQNINYENEIIIYLVNFEEKLEAKKTISVCNLFLSEVSFLTNNPSEVLSFNTFFSKEKRQLLLPERILEFNNRHYIIREVTLNCCSNKTIQVVAEALWYDLGDEVINNPFFLDEFINNWKNRNLNEILEKILQNSIWILDKKSDKIDISYSLLREKKENKKLKFYTILKFLIWAQKATNCIIEFDTKNKKILLRDINRIFEFSKYKTGLNIEDITIKYDSRNIVTYYSLTGKDGLIGHINEDTKIPNSSCDIRNDISNYYKTNNIQCRKRFSEYSDNNLTKFDEMKNLIIKELNENSFPVVKYDIKIIEENINDYPKLNDIIQIEDDCLNINEKAILTKKYMDLTDLKKSSFEFMFLKRRI